MKLFHQGHRLFLSIVGSILLHCLAIAVVQKYSVWYYAYTRMMNPKEITIEKTSFSKKHLLKTTFRKSSLTENNVDILAKSPKKEFSHSSLKASEVEKIVDDLDVSVDLKKTLKRYAADHLIVGLKTHPGNVLQSIQYPTQNHQLVQKLKDIARSSNTLLNRFEVKPDELKNVVVSFEGNEELRNVDEYASLDLYSQETVMQVDPISSSHTQSCYPITINNEESTEKSESKAEKISNTLPHLPNLKTLKTRSISECFEMDIVYTKATVSNGYVFAITLIPNPNTEFQKLKQNFHFLIDRNNSIQARRLHATGHAVMRALSYIPKGDRFNIIAYDSRLEKFSSFPQETKKQNIRQAKNFLMNQKIASFFTESNLFKTLRTLSVDRKKTNELNTIILLTDGETLTNRHKDMFTLSHWLGISNKQYSLYTLSLNHDRNLPLLNLLSEMSRGKLYLAQNRKAVKRKLIKLMQSIAYPIATEVTTSAIAKAPDTEIQLYPSNERMCNLYQSAPFVLIGTTKKLEDFILFVQGKHKNEWLNLKKTISFKNAKNVGENLEQQWALHEAFNQFETFMKDGNPYYLQQATDILNHKKINSPFP